MKKTNLLSILMLALLLITSCDSDDDLNTTTETTPTTPNIVLNEIEYLGDSVEIRNNGNETVDISDFFLCLGPTTYRQIGALPVVSGSTTLEPGALLVVTYDQINSAAGQISNVSGTGGLGLYINNSGFANAANLVDFVQWGASGSTRETTAVEAGIWTDGEFVPVVNNPANSIIFDGMGNSASDFSETTTPSFGTDNDVATAPMVRSVVLNEVEFLGDRVEILNNGNVDVDISDYFLCLGPGTYRQVGALPVVSGSTMLAPGEFLVVTYDPINSMAGQINGVSGTGGLGLYIDNTGFGDPSTISDFVQWGDSGSSRETTAVAAGIWTMGDFVSVTSTATNSIIYDGMGDEASDFSETTTPSFGMENGMASPPAAVISLILNEIEYLGDRVEIFNNSDVAVDISGYFLCLGPGTYRQIGNLPIVSGNTMMEPGDFLVVTYDQINTTAGQINNDSGTGGLGLYINATGFGNPDNLMDFVQWGGSGSVRETTAVAAGIWTMGDFVSVTNTAANSIEYDGSGDTAADFNETTMPSFGSANQ